VKKRGGWRVNWQEDVELEMPSGLLSAQLFVTRCGSGSGGGGSRFRLAYVVWSML
jgi:hypothetical protein